MDNKLRLGPVAVFLTIVAVILTTLATLTIATSRADVVLAERFAEMTQIRYSLEAQGSEFLSSLAEELAAGASLSSISELNRKADGIFEYKAERDGYELVIRLTESDEDLYNIREWKITKVWEEEDLNQGIWAG